MKKAIKKKWVAALLSGEYPQGQEALKREGKYCCLGVLCDVVGYKVRRGQIFLPKVVAKQAGIEYIGQNPDSSRGVQGALANRNDTGHTFEQIAEYIEANL